MSEAKSIGGQHIDRPKRSLIRSAQMRRRTDNLATAGAMIGCMLFTAGLAKVVACDRHGAGYDHA